MKKVIYTETASAALRKHANRSRLIAEKIERYASDPLSEANNVTALTGSEYRRLRVGNFRIVFLESPDTITIIKIGPRSHIYR